MIDSPICEHNLLPSPPSREIRHRIQGNCFRRTILLCSVHASYVQNHKFIPNFRNDPPSFAETATNISLHVQRKRQRIGIKDSALASRCVTSGRFIDIIHSERGFSGSRISCRRHRPPSGNFCGIVSARRIQSVPITSPVAKAFDRRDQQARTG